MSRRALDGRRKVLGPEHPNTLRLLEPGHPDTLLSDSILAMESNCTIGKVLVLLSSTDS